MAIKSVGTGSAGAIPAIQLGTNQVVDIEATSNATDDAFESPLVRVAVTAACYVEFGATPEATSASVYMPAGSVEYFIVSVGDKAAVLRVSDDGVAHFTEAV